MKRPGRQLPGRCRGTQPATDIACAPCYCGKPVALNFSRLPSGIAASFVTLAAFLTAWLVETVAASRSCGRPVAPNFSRLPSDTWVSSSATRATFVSTVPAAWLKETLATARRMGFDAAPPVESAKRAEEKNSKVPARTIAARMIESPLLSIHQNCRFIALRFARVAPHDLI